MVERIVANDKMGVRFSLPAQEEGVAEQSSKLRIDPCFRDDFLLSVNNVSGKWLTTVD